MTQRTIAKALSVWLLIGCARTHLHAGIDRHDAPGKSGLRTGAAGGNAEAAAVGSVTGGSSAALDNNRTPASAEVWIGQLWSQTPTLCDPNESPSDSDFMFDPAGIYERVALVLETDAQGRLSGRIKFGEGMAPASPGITKSDDGSEAWHCEPWSLTTGVEYTVLDATRTPNRLRFQIVPNEAWISWCAMQTDVSLVCGCKRDKCEADLHGRSALDLAITADSMEGDIFNASLGGQLRLRRVQ